MAIRVYDTLKKEKVDFSPVEPGKVKMYLCGPTVYGFLHVGNFRGAIFFNVVRNWLEKRGYEVTYVYNYTDVDDKIIKRANEEGVTSLDISERYIAEFEKDFARLNLRKHDHNPKVTEYMPQIITFIDELVKKGMAYVVDGEVFYEISKFDSYGKLSGKKLDDLEAGARVEIDQRKHSPADFVLWKPAKPNEPSWDSPWGKGRPGWHIECSAMIQAILGSTIDIHGGGIDLIFPHHENEIAQGEGHSGECYCNHWMHNNFINFDNEKMSKSLGNIITGRSFMDKYNPEVLKFLMLSGHYRVQINFGQERISQAIGGLSRIYVSLRDAETVAGDFEMDESLVDKSLIEMCNKASANIEESLDDDFNTPEVLAQIFEVVRHYNGLNLVKKKKNASNKSTSAYFKNWVASSGEMMSLFQEAPSSFLAELDDILITERNIDIDHINKLINERNQARADKNYQRSDEIRDELDQLGILVMDGVEGRGWEVDKRS